MKLELNGSIYNIAVERYPDDYGYKIIEQAKRFGYMCYNYYEKIDDKKSNLIIFSNAYGVIKSIVDNEDIERLSKITWRPTYSRRTNSFYIENTIHGKIHRFILGFKKKENVELKVDHIDRNSLNNSKDNLRLVTQAMNCKNSSLRSDNTSGIKGIRFEEKRNRWSSEIYVNGKKYSRTYSVNKYGNEEAKRLAIEFRRKIAEENGYIKPFE